MITFCVNEKQAVVKINSGVGPDEEILFGGVIQNDRQTPHLVIAHLRERLNLTVEQIRKEAYNLGWKDAKGKKQKKRRNFYYFLKFGRGVGW